jgi:hypothetical protein
MRNLRALWFLLIPAVAIATVSIAQDASPGDPPPMPDIVTPIDAETLQRDRSDDANPPDDLQQTENAGSMRMTMPGETRASSTTVTEESSTTVTFGRSDAADGDSSSASSGWSGSGRSSRGQQSGWGPVIKLNAGPIWNNDDAPGKCARTCGNAGLGWTGEWKTVAEMQSVCSCASPRGGGHGGSWAGGGGRGSSCSAPDNYQCAGCSVSCPAGKEARCTQGDRGIFTGDRDRICSKDAKCECV